MDRIPIVNLATIIFNPEEWKERSKEFVKALHTFGFVYLENHGVNQDKVHEAFMSSKEFFERPKQLKEMYCYEASPKGYHGQGYTIKEGGQVFEVRECFDFTGKMNKKEDDDSDFHEKLQKLHNECLPLVKLLFKMLATGLELESQDFFLDKCRWLDNPDGIPSFKTFRTLYYPRIPEDVEITEGVLRVKEHADFDFLTLLFQDSIGGLEIKTREGKWIQATPIPDTVIVNIGDLLQVWSGGYFPATKHRVQIPESVSKKRIPRQSIAYFLHPDSNAIIKPIPSPIMQPYSFKEFPAYEHIKAKLASVRSY